VKAQIDVVFPTNSSCAQALECIAHLREPVIAGIVVVDNASSDDTVAAVRAAHPDVTVVALSQHTGISAALNRGAEHGSAPFILYLNDDVFAVPGSIPLLLATLQARPEAVAAGGRLVSDDLVTQDRYRPRAFPSPATVVARLFGLDRIWPRNPVTGGHLRRMLDDETTVAVDQPAGACLLVRRPTVERVGGWDERYWFWYEDVDFSRRLAAHGEQLYVPAAPFRHVGGSTVARMRRAESHRSTFHGIVIYAQTHFTRRGRVAVGLALALIGLARALRSLPADRDAARIYMAAGRAGVALLAGRRVAGVRDAGVGVQPRALNDTDNTAPAS
jgi:GT2 family glycosyltransferase